MKLVYAKAEMLRFTQFVIILDFIAETLAVYYGELRISGGSESGRLEFYDGSKWGAVCKNGFGDVAGDVACRQLGYEKSSDVYTYAYYYNSDDISVCYTSCNGYENELTSCYIKSDYCSSCDVVGITCGYYTYGELRISDINLLEFYNGTHWGAICKDGFYDAADVACRQLGYRRSSDVYGYYYNDDDISVCYTSCNGYEDELIDCYIDISHWCQCDVVVSITCTNLSPTLPPEPSTIPPEAHRLSTGATVGIVIGVLVFVGLITTAIILCICCLTPRCPFYYNKRRFHTTGTVVVAQQAPQALPAITNPKNAKYQPLSTYDPDTGY